VTDRRGALEALERILNRGGEPEVVLGQVVSVLEGLYDHVAIRPLEDGSVSIEAEPLGEADGEFLQRVALIISPYCWNL
jgi:hypothetical protein